VCGGSGYVDLREVELPFSTGNDKCLLPGHASLVITALLGSRYTSESNCKSKGLER